MKWLRKSAELKNAEMRLRTEMARKERQKPCRWFAWYPVMIRKTTEGKLQYVWLEVIWKWLDSSERLNYSFKKPKQ